MENFDKSIQKQKIQSGDDEKKMIIHTMPKRFLGLKPKQGNTKNIGAAILIIGVFLLFGILAALYFFVLKPGNNSELKNDDFFIEEEHPVKQNLPKESSSAKAAEDRLSPPEVTEDTAADVEDMEGGITDKEEEKPREIIFATTSDNFVATSGEEEIDINENGKIDYISAIDSDQDGLSDLEEIIFDCNINSDDSDGDGYKDLDELEKLYNPAGSGKIMVNPNIEKYINASHKYSIYYPNIWLKTDVDGDNSVLFRAGNNQYMQIIVQNNTKKQSLEEWYKEQLNVSSVRGSQMIYKTGWDGIKSEDGLIAYLTQRQGDKIFIISYNVGLDNMLRFKNIFGMIVKSFELAN
ncbi:MAG: PsbP-related protein [Patescibacteria group bacterium]|nr:PsbP-related protein [Patescibacteria group bacterium]